MINIGLSPNLSPDDSFLALKMLLQPWKWKKGKAVGELEDWFRKYTGMKNVKSFNSGRSGEYEILKAFGIGKGDEVLLQAFTCVAVPNSVLWTAATPVYVDIDESLTMDPADLEKKITARSKAIIIQHTFGNLANLKEIGQIGEKHGLIIIEDCAHTIKKDIQADAAFFSFGRDKAVSSVFGGFGVIREHQGKKGEWGRSLDFPSYFWIFQQLLHPVAMAVILPLYNRANLGKLVLWVLQKLKLLSFPVYPLEKEGNRPKFFPSKMPNALAELALVQLGKLDQFEKKRKEISGIYDKELKNLDSGQARMTGRILKPFDSAQGKQVPLLRYSILVENPDELREFAKKRGVILGNWYSNVIDPKGTDFQKIGYKQSFSSSHKGSCPKAEEIAGKIVNLPTYPRMSQKDAYKVVEVIKEYFSYV